MQWEMLFSVPRVLGSRLEVALWVSEKRYHTNTFPWEKTLKPAVTHCHQQRSKNRRVCSPCSTPKGVWGLTFGSWSQSSLQGKADYLPSSLGYFQLKEERHQVNWLARSTQQDKKSLLTQDGPWAVAELPTHFNRHGEKFKCLPKTQRCIFPTHHFF